MRDRPFLQASEAPRPFSEVKAERGDGALTDTVLRRVEALEAEALEAQDQATARRLLCEAEDLRCALHEAKPGGVR